MSDMRKHKTEDSISVQSSLTMSTYLTRSSAIAERGRCRVRYSFGQKWKTGTGRQYFTDIICLSSTTVMLSAWKSVEFGEKKRKIRKIRAITVFRVVQGHTRSSRSVSIESSYAISYLWLIVTGILYRTVSELSQLIVQILDTLHFWATLWKLRATYHVHLGLIGKRVVDFLLVLIKLFFASCYSWEATSEKRSKIGDFATIRSQFDPKF